MGKRMDTLESAHIFETPARVLEHRMRTISILISLVALALMLIGFAAGLATADDGVAVPGKVSITPARIFSMQSVSGGLSEMTAGILLLAALPGARIILAIWLYLRSREFLNTLVALAVLVELLLSTRF